MSREKNSTPDAMTAEFLVEIKEDLSNLEPDLLAMEENGSRVDDGLINHAFRSIHSIKGGAGFIDFKPLSELGHAMESVLMAIREKKLEINSQIADALLSGLDKMKLMVDAWGSDREYGHDQETASLTALLQDDGRKKEKVVPEKEADQPDSQDEICAERLCAVGKHPVFSNYRFPVDPERLSRAIESQKFIYVLHVREPGGIADDIKSIGDILYSGPGIKNEDAETRAPETEPSFFVISTILDLPLLSQVLDIEKFQIALMEKQFAPCEQILKGFGQDPDLGADPPAGEKKTPGQEQEAVNEPASRLFPGSTTSLTPTIRVNVDLISRLMNRAGELVLSRNQLRSFMEQTGKGDPRANHIMQNLDMVTSNIQEAIMQMRMQPVIELLGKYKRVVRDIARRMEKKVDLVLAGTGVELDRNILEKLASPLTHIIRNCIDHGIEDPEERERIGKPRTGTIRIETFQQSGHVHMTISDDGAGIDPQLVLSKAFEKGLVTEDQMQDMTERQKVDLVFLPGFSTSREITDISGRGVGMDVVKTNIEQLRGRIEIHTRINRGTVIKLIFPLTLSIVPSLIVSSGEHKFALPRSSIKETIFMEPGKIHEQVVQIAGAEAIRLRNRLTPVLRLRNVLDLPAYTRVPGQERLQQEKRKAIADRRGQKTGQWEGREQRSKDERRMNPWDATYVILLKVGMDVFGLCVDEIYDIEEVVVEPLNPYIKHLECYAGATILGDGNVIMILDVAGIAAFSDLKFEAVRQEETMLQESAPEEGKDASKSCDLIVFSNADSEYFGIELTRLTRLKSLDPLKIYQVEKDRYIRYDNQAVQLFTMDEILPASPGDLSSGSLFVVFPKSLKSDAGIIASKIVDTVQCDASVFERKNGTGIVLNKIFINDMMVQILDHDRLRQAIERRMDAAGSV